MVKLVNRGNAKKDNSQIIVPKSKTTTSICIDAVPKISEAKKFFYFKVLIQL